MDLSLVATANSGNIYKNPNVFPPQVTFQLKKKKKKKTILTKKKRGNKRNKIISILYSRIQVCVSITELPCKYRYIICTTFHSLFIQVNKSLQ